MAQTGEKSAFRLTRMAALACGLVGATVCGAQAGQDGPETFDWVAAEEPGSRINFTVRIDLPTSAPPVFEASTLTGDDLATSTVKSADWFSGAALPSGGAITLNTAEEGGGDMFNDPSEAARKTSNPLGGDFMVLINEWDINFLKSDRIPALDDGGKSSSTSSNR